MKYVSTSRVRLAAIVIGVQLALSTLLCVLCLDSDYRTCMNNRAEIVPLGCHLALPVYGAASSCSYATGKDPSGKGTMIVFIALYVFFLGCSLGIVYLWVEGKLLGALFATPAFLGCGFCISLIAHFWFALGAV